MPPTIDRELEIKLDQLRPNTYRVELRFNDPNSDAGGQVATGEATFDFDALNPVLPNSEYGKQLTEALFADPPIRRFFGETKARAADANLRLRLFIDANAFELNSLRWELLRDPDTELMLTTSERMQFSRFVLTRDWRPVKLRARSQLRALIAVSSPTNLPAGMAQVRKEVEIPAARKALAGIDITVLGENEPVTLNALIAEIRKGVDIVYLVCHGSLPSDKIARLFLQNERGELQFALGADLAQSFGDLPQPPRLMVLASCESGGSAGVFAHSALAPLLANAGVPAIIAMQAKVSMRTVELAMPVFFSELLKDGQIDRSMAAARAAVRTELDAWVPALFLRLKSGSLWYQPGFGGGNDNDEISWASVCQAVVNLDLVPVLGPDLAEHILGTSMDFAAELAREHNMSLPSDARPDSAKIAQTIQTNAGEAVLRANVKQFANERIQQTAIKLHAGAKQAGLPNPATLSGSEQLDFVVNQLYQDPNEPFRILTDLPVKVFVSGAMDTLLKRFLKKKGKVPVELFSDWRKESKVDEERIRVAAAKLHEMVEQAPGVPALDLFDQWFAALPLPNEKALPLSLLSAAHVIEERLVENPDSPALDLVRDWRDKVRVQPGETISKPWSFLTPVLYYVYGKVRYENTWVLTEDDFFDYLIRHSSYQLMPQLVADKLVAGSLLFLGFSMDDWKFRILFRMIMSKEGSELLKNLKYKHIGVQVDPEQYTPAEAARLKPLLVKYFGDAAKINIYWGSSSDFLIQLRDHLKDPKYNVPTVPPPARRRGE